MTEILSMQIKIAKWGHSAAIRLPAPMLAQLETHIGALVDVEIVDGAMILRPVAVVGPPPDAAIEAMKYALRADEGIEFLRCWMHGEFDAIRNEWPDAPEAIFVGADPLHGANG